MRGFLLDTNLLSELRRPVPSAGVVAFVAAQPDAVLHVSEVSFAEIRFGVERLTEGDRRAALETWLDRSLRPWFGPRALAVSEDILLRWRRTLEAGRKQGHTYSPIDLLIASTAAEHGLIVVIRDVTHFVAARVPTLDPWSELYFNAAGAARKIEHLNSPDVLGALS